MLIDDGLEGFVVEDVDRTVDGDDIGSGDVGVQELADFGFEVVVVDDIGVAELDGVFELLEAFEVFAVVVERAIGGVGNELFEGEGDRKGFGEGGEFAVEVVAQGIVGEELFVEIKFFPESYETIADKQDSQLRSPSKLLKKGCWSPNQNLSKWMQREQIIVSCHQITCFTAHRQF